MTHGVAIYNAIGEQVLDADGNAPRLVDDFVVSAGTSGSRSYPLVEGDLFAAACPETTFSTPFGFLSNPHVVTVSGFTVVWSLYNVPPYGAGYNTDTRILVFTK